MSEELLYTLITKMHVKLNMLIESKNYNLLNEDVQRYSRILDRALVHYNRLLEQSKKNTYCAYKCKKTAD